MLARLANIILSFVVFFSTTGVVLNRHYCQSHVRKTALFVTPQSCHAQQVSPPCHLGASKHCSLDDEDNGCCHDDSEYVHTDQVKVFQTPAVWVLPVFKPVHAVPVFALRLSANEALASRHHHRYRPPDLHPSAVEAAALLQVFRC